MKDISGYEGLYAVTKDGRVWSYPKPCSSKNGMWLKLQLFTNRNNRGRPHVQYTVGLAKYGKRTTYLVHRLIAQAFLPNPKHKPQINHIDGNPLNNNISNLEWATAAENNQHSRKMGLVDYHSEKQDAIRSANGKKTGKINGAKARRKFTPLEVMHIKELHASGKKSCRAIARDYGCSNVTISNICNNKTYQFDL